MRLDCPEGFCRWTSWQMIGQDKFKECYFCGRRMWQFGHHVRGGQDKEEGRDEGHKAEVGTNREVSAGQEIKLPTESPPMGQLEPLPVGGGSEAVHSLRLPGGTTEEQGGGMKEQIAEAHELINRMKQSTGDLEAYIKKVEVLQSRLESLSDQRVGAFDLEVLNRTTASARIWLQDELKGWPVLWNTESLETVLYRLAELQSGQQNNG